MSRAPNLTLAELCAQRREWRERQQTKVIVRKRIRPVEKPPKGPHCKECWALMTRYSHDLLCGSCRVEKREVSHG